MSDRWRNPVPPLLRAVLPVRWLGLASLLFSVNVQAGPRSPVRRVLRLINNVSQLPDVDEQLLQPAIEAAVAAETKRIPAELLIAIAWGESRLNPHVRTGVVCGPMQVNPTDIGRPRSDCEVWERDITAGYRAGVTELETMLQDPRVHGSLERALLYRACGNALFRGKCTKMGWARWVLDRAAALRRNSDEV